MSNFERIIRRKAEQRTSRFDNRQAGYKRDAINQAKAIGGGFARGIARGLPAGIATVFPQIVSKVTE